MPPKRFTAYPVTDKGILQSLQGGVIGSAIVDKLPKAEDAPSDRMIVDTVDPFLGPVRITFERYTYRHYKDRFTSWRAIRAERSKTPERLESPIAQAR